MIPRFYLDILDWSRSLHDRGAWVAGGRYSLIILLSARSLGDRTKKTGNSVRPYFELPRILPLCLIAGPQSVYIYIFKLSNGSITVNTSKFRMQEVNLLTPFESDCFYAERCRWNGVPRNVVFQKVTCASVRYH